MTKVCMSPAPARRWDDILLRTHPLRPRLAWFLGVALAAGAGAAPGQQRSLGPDVPHVRVVGRSPGFAPMIGLDSSRTGSSRSRLPTWPEAEWAYHVDGGLTGPAAVLRLGQAHVASPAGHLAAVSAAGIPLWKLRLDTPAAAPPVILSDGSTAVVTASAEAIVVARTGRTLWETRLPVRPGLPTTLLPLWDGTLVIAAGNQLLHLEHDGHLRRRTSVGHPVHALLSYRDLVVVVAEQGDIYLWNSIGDARFQGSLGAGLRAGPVLSGTQLVTALGAGQVVNFDLETGEIGKRWPESPWRVTLPLAVSGNGAVAAISEDGALLRENTPGSLSTPILVADAHGGGRAVTAAPEGLFHPGPIEDTHGTVAFALPTGHVGVVTRQGSVRLAKVRDCQTPVGLTPAGPNRLLVACSSGQLISVRQRPSRASKP